MPIVVETKDYHNAYRNSMNMNNMRHRKLFDSNQKPNKSSLSSFKSQKNNPKPCKSCSFSEEEDYGRLLEAIMQNEDLYQQLKTETPKNKSSDYIKETDQIQIKSRPCQEHNNSQKIVSRHPSQRFYPGTPQKTKNPIPHNELESATKDTENVCLHCQVGTPKSSIPISRFNPVKVPVHPTLTPNTYGQSNKTKPFNAPSLGTGPRRPGSLKYEVGYYVDPNEAGFVQKLECEDSYHSSKPNASVESKYPEVDTRSLTDKDATCCCCYNEMNNRKTLVETQTQCDEAVHKQLSNCATQTAEQVKPAKLSVTTQATDQATFRRTCAQRYTAKASNISTNRRGRGGGRTSTTTSSRSTVGRPSPANVNPWNIGHIKAMVHEIRDVAAATRDADLDRIVNDLEWAVRTVLSCNGSSSDAKSEISSQKEENENLKKQVKKLQDQWKELNEKVTVQCMTESCKKKEEALRSEISGNRLSMDNLSNQFDSLQNELRTVEEQRDKLGTENQNLLLLLCQKDTELIQARHCFLQTEAKLKEEINSYIDQLAEMENNFLMVKHQLDSREHELSNCQSAVRDVHKHLAQFMNQSSSGVRGQNDRHSSQSGRQGTLNSHQMLRKIYNMLSPTKEEDKEQFSPKKKRGKSVRIVLCDADSEKHTPPSDKFHSNSAHGPDTNDMEEPADRKSSTYSSSSQSSDSTESRDTETQQSSLSQLTRENLKQFERKQKEMEQHMDLTVPNSWYFNVEENGDGADDEEAASEMSSTTKDALLTVPSSKDRMASSVHQSKGTTQPLDSNDPNESHSSSITCTSASMHLTVVNSSSSSKSPSPRATKLSQKNPNHAVSINNNHYKSDTASGSINLFANKSRKRGHPPVAYPERRECSAAVVNVVQDCASVTSDMKESCCSAQSSVSSLRSNDDWQFKYGLEKLDAEIKKLQSSLKHSSTKTNLSK